MAAHTYRDKAKATAAALLKDESFIIKYPALARALRESVDPLETDCGSSTSNRAATRSTEKQEAANLLPADAEVQPDGAGLHECVSQDNTPACSAADQSAHASSDTGATAQVPVEAHQLSNGMKSTVTALTSNSGGSSSVEQQAPPHSTPQPKPQPTAEGTREVLHTGGSPHEAGNGTQTAAAGGALPIAVDGEKVLDPPLHYMKRALTELCSTGRAARPQGPLDVNGWKQVTREQQEQQRAIMQPQRISAPVVPNRVSWAPAKSAPTASHPASVPESFADRTASLYQMQQHLRQEKPRPTVDPAVLYEKTGMDLAVQHLRDQAERMHAQSRDITRAITQKKQLAELEALREKNAHPLLTELTLEQQRLIEEQLRCIDEAGSTDEATDLQEGQTLQDVEGGVPVRRGDGPATYKSKFPGIYPEPEYANALPVSQQARRELFRKMQHEDGKVRVFGDFVEEANRKEAEALRSLMAEEEQMMEQQREKREEDDEWARICLSKLHSKNLALQEAEEARTEAEEAKRSLEEMRRREEQLIAERDAMSELARKREEEAARAIEEAERQAAAAAAAAAAARKVPSRSPTLTVEAAAGGMPRRGASALSRSRTVSLSRAPHTPSEHQDGTPSRATSKEMPLNGATPRLSKTVQDSFEIAAPKRLHTAIPQQGRRKGEVLNNALAERLPPYRCEEFVFLSPPVEATPAKLKFLYGQLKRVFSAGELGSCEHVQLVYDFAVGCCQEFVRDDSASQEYANALIQSLPYYPYQIDIQRAGIIGLLNIFEASKFQEHLAPPIFETLTTLMAIDDKELRSDIIAVVINTDLVDLLLQQIDESSDCEIVAFCIHILIVARSPHRKSTQYSVFLKSLGKWKHEPTVLTRACLAIDAAGQRAQLEGLAAHERNKQGSSGHRLEGGYEHLRRPPSYGEDVQLVDSITPKWMPDDASDVDKAFPLLLLAASTHPDSQSVASGFANTIAIVGKVNGCKNYLTQEMVDEVNAAIQRHRCAPEVISACCAALTALEVFYSPQSEVCAYGCRAIARLVYKEPDDSKIYADLMRTRAMTTVLFVMFKHSAESCLAEDALRWRSFVPECVAIGRRSCQRIRTTWKLWRKDAVVSGCYHTNLAFSRWLRIVGFYLLNTPQQDIPARATLNAW
ncbi:hypothetical protein, conserved [Eimeria praecox]|uniref:Uncharacterized protein n=1 Tax=Eimeria praecox TaxID=51316 RepID=U6H006_9EIME|nr:hypothetical protein, conserved [Eimeria praecox]